MNPVWPIAVRRHRVPHDDVGSIVSQPSARELPGTPVFARELRHRRRRAERRRLAKRPQHEARKRADGRRRAEQSRVTGDAAERGGVFVVHFACSTRPRHGSCSVGAMRSAILRREETSVAGKSSRASAANCASSGAPPASSSAKPSRMKPGIRIDRLRCPARTRAADSRGSRSYSPRPCARSHSRACAGRPEE